MIMRCSFCQEHETEDETSAYLHLVVAHPDRTPPIAQHLQTLLQKYVKYIQCCEGTDYIGIHDQRAFHRDEVAFVPEEWALLEKLSEDSWVSG